MKIIEAHDGEVILTDEGMQYTLKGHALIPGVMCEACGENEGYEIESLPNNSRFLCPRCVTEGFVFLVTKDALMRLERDGLMDREKSARILQQMDREVSTFNSPVPYVDSLSNAYDYMRGETFEEMCAHIQGVFTEIVNMLGEECCYYSPAPNDLQDYAHDEDGDSQSR